MDLVAKKKAFLPVWAYLEFEPNSDRSKVNETVPVCRPCKATVSAKLGNTSNLLSQLKHKHPQQYLDIQSASMLKSVSKADTSCRQATIQKSHKNSQPYSQTLVHVSVGNN